MIIPFDGFLLRTAAIHGAVTVEGSGLEDVTVSLNGEGEHYEILTNTAGQYRFDGLRAGEYTVTISGFDANVYEFETTTRTVSVERRETATVSFEGRLVT